jgi:hypothetical protein
MSVEKTAPFPAANLNTTNFHGSFLTRICRRYPIQQISGCIHRCWRRSLILLCYVDIGHLSSLRPHLPALRSSANSTTSHALKLISRGSWPSTSHTAAVICELVSPPTYLEVCFLGVRTWQRLVLRRGLIVGCINWPVGVAYNHRYRWRSLVTGISL